MHRRCASPGSKLRAAALAEPGATLDAGSRALLGRELLPDERERLLAYVDLLARWNRAYNLTSVLPGNGGVWALCAPHLLFIPDRDGKAGEPRIVLDGWSLATRHNIVNGLLWGPDGWIYGRHGIIAESRAGTPGTPKEITQRLSDAIGQGFKAADLRKRILSLEAEPLGNSPDEMRKMIQASTAHWAPVIEAAKISID